MDADTMIEPQDPTARASACEKENLHMGASARPPRDCNGARIEPFLDPGYIRVVKQVAKRSAVPLVEP